MSDPSKDRAEDSEVARLLRAVGRGPRLSNEARARIYGKLHAQWSETVAAGARTSRAAELTRPRAPRSSMPLWLGLAATVAAIAVLVVELRAPSVPGAPFATVARVEGRATIERGGQSRSVGAEDPALVLVGDRLRTDPDGRVALTLATGQSLRIHSNTALTVADAASIDLEAGTVYFDSLELDDRSFDVRTAFGVVRHIGTRYEASFNAARLRVRVREGAAAVDTGRRELETQSGEQLQISAEGDISRAAFAADDAAWRWVEELATVSPAAAHNLLEILRWVSRETGVTLVFDEPATEARARTVEVSGLAGFDPHEALEAIGMTTAFSYRWGDGRLAVASVPL